MLGLLEQLAGAALVAVVLVDVFLNVLYARAGVAIISRPLVHLVRDVFLFAGRRAGSETPRVLSFIGPSVVVAILSVWMAGLVLGCALIIHPALGHAVRSDIGATSTGFATALYAAGGSVSSAGAGNIAPHTPAFRIFFMLEPLLGVSVLTLTISYLLQLYSAVKARNVLAMKVELMTGRTGDAAHLVAALGPEGRFDVGYAVLAELGAELVQVKEAHHLYPVLFYFRFPLPFYDLSRFTLVLLDACSLMRAALDERHAGWLKRSAALETLEGGGLVLVETLRRVYLRGRDAQPEPPDPGQEGAWRARFARAVAVMRAERLPVRRDLAECASAYVVQRARWHHLVYELGRAIGAPPHEADPALFMAQERRKPPEPGRPVLH
jgi:hypothetical protein